MSDLEINIDITSLLSYKYFLLKFDDKIKFNNYTISNVEQKIIISNYVYLILFRFLFFLDFLHDFTDKNRPGNKLYTKKNSVNNNLIKDTLINNYYNTYKKDKLLLKEILKKYNVNNYDLNILCNQKNIILKKFKDTTDVKFEDIDSINNIESYSLDKIKLISKSIILFIGIDIYENLENLDNKYDFNCNNNLYTLLENIKYKNINEIEKLDIFIDADRSRFNAYPFVLKLCEILNNNQNLQIRIQESIVDKYDSAGTSLLKYLLNKTTNQLKNSDKNKYYDSYIYSKYYVKKNKNSTIKISINFKNENLITLNFKDKSTINKNNVYLEINNFFGINCFLNETNKSSLSDTTIKINDILNGNLNKLILIFKTKLNNIIYLNNDRISIDKIKSKDIKLYNDIIKLSREILVIDDNECLENMLENKMNEWVCINNQILTRKNDMLTRINNLINSGNNDMLKSLIKDFVNKWYGYANTIDKSDYYKNCKYNLQKFKEEHLNKYTSILESFKLIFNEMNYINDCTIDDRFIEIYLNKIKKCIENEMISTMNNYVCDNNGNINLVDTVIKNINKDFNVKSTDFVTMWYGWGVEKFDYYLKDCKYNFPYSFKKDKTYQELLTKYYSLTKIIDNLVISTSLFKTMGDFSKIIYAYNYNDNNVCKIINPKNLTIFISFDKSSGYISSLFNLVTLDENNENPLIPLRLLTPSIDAIRKERTYWNTFKDACSYIITTFSPGKKPRTITSFGKNNYKKILEKYSRNYNNQKQKEKPNKKNSKQKNSKEKEITVKQLQEIAKKYGLPLRKEYSKKDQLKRKLKHMFKLADKYKIKLNKNTYKNLYKLHISRLR